VAERKTKALLAVLAATAVALAGARMSGQTRGSQEAREVPLFEVDPTWPRLPNNWVMGVVSAVAVDRSDHVWLLNRYRVGVPESLKDRVAPPVLEFDAAGTFVQARGGQAGDQEHCLYIDHRDNVWI
jgi:hypothetical protein